MVESCEGVPEPLENCNALEYTVTIDATTGRLRLANRNTVHIEHINQAALDGSSQVQITGKMDIVNALLNDIEFSPVCDDVNPGMITLLISAQAEGPQAKT